MYSQPWSPTPSTTAVAPLLRTQKRSPTRPIDVGFAARRSVEQGVSGNDVPFGREARPGGRNDDDPAAGEALAEIVVGVAFEAERDSRREEGPKLCPALPRNVTESASAGRPPRPHFRVTYPLSMAPTLRSVLAIGKVCETLFPSRRIRSASGSSSWSGTSASGVPAAGGSGCRRRRRPVEQTPQIEPCDGALRRCGALAQQVAASDQIVRRS